LIFTTKRFLPTIHGFLCFRTPPGCSSYGCGGLAVTNYFLKFRVYIGPERAVLGLTGGLSARLSGGLSAGLLWGPSGRGWFGICFGSILQCFGRVILNNLGPIWAPTRDAQKPWKPFLPTPEDPPPHPTPSHATTHLHSGHGVGKCAPRGLAGVERGGLSFGVGLRWFGV
jgi:hypothetical protein